MPNDSIDRLFTSLNRASEALFDSLRAGNDRAQRFSMIVIEEADKTQTERLDLARHWVESPGDVVGLARATMRTWTRRQRRRLGRGREFITEIRDEVRDRARRATSGTKSRGRQRSATNGQPVTSPSEESDIAPEAPAKTSNPARGKRR